MKSIAKVSCLCLALGYGFSYTHAATARVATAQQPDTIHKQPSARTLVRIQRRRRTNQTSKILIDKCPAGLDV